MQPRSVAPSVFPEAIEFCDLLRICQRRCNAFSLTRAEIVDDSDDGPDVVSSLNRSRGIEVGGMQSIHAGSHGHGVCEPLFLPAAEGPRKIVDISLSKHHPNGGDARDPGAAKQP